jgi:hypothetical protein
MGYKQIDQNMTFAEMSLMTQISMIFSLQPDFNGSNLSKMLI